MTKKPPRRSYPLLDKNGKPSTWWYREPEDHRQRRGRIPEAPPAPIEVEDVEDLLDPDAPPPADGDSNGHNAMG